MELKDLYALQYLKSELEYERRKHYRLVQQSTSLVPVITGMPRGTDNQSKVERYGIQIHDTETRIRALEKRIAELEDFIDSVRPDDVRVIMKLKFGEGFTYQQIALNIGGKNTKDSVRMILKRYFKER